MVDFAYGFVIDVVGVLVFVLVVVAAMAGFVDVVMGFEVIMVCVAVSVVGVVVVIDMADVVDEVAVVIVVEFAFSGKVTLNIFVREV